MEDLLGDGNPQEAHQTSEKGPMLEKKISGGGSGRRPPPPLPPPTAAADEASFVPVDGVPTAFVESLFAEADADSDGRVADEEARSFFLRTKLSPRELSTIWRVVKPPTAAAQAGKGLSKRRFSQALRLVALVQSGAPLTPELATAALLPASWAAKGEAPLPAPLLGPAVTPSPFALERLGNPFKEGAAAAPPAAAAAPLVAQQPDSAEEAGMTGLDFLGVEQPVPSLLPTASSTVSRRSGEGFVPLEAPIPEGASEDDIFGLAMLAQASTAPLAERPSPLLGKGSLTRSQRVQSLPRGSSHNFSSASLEAPLAYELRYPPLNPKTSAKLTVMAAVNGALLAGPSLAGGLLHWVNIQDDVKAQLHHGQTKRQLTRNDSSMMSTHEVVRSATGEDVDAAPSVEATATPRGKGATCVAVDDARGILWVGDKDGWVAAYDFKEKPPGARFEPAAQMLHCWQAHRVGSVATMGVGPGGELWTGSSRGSIRVWQPAGSGIGRDGGGAGSPGPVVRELRRPGGERAHSGPVASIVCTADGQLMWTAGSRNVVLWDSRSGAFLGSLLREPPTAATPTANAMHIGASLLLDGRISSATGLDVDPLHGAVIARPPTADRERLALQQEAWAAQSDRGVVELAERLSEGAGKAVKFVGKLGARLAGMTMYGGGSSAGNSGSGGSAATAASTAVAAVGPPPPEDDPSEPHSGGGGSGDVVALVATPDNCLWVAHRKGRVERYSFAGRLLGARQFGGRVQTAAAVGRRVWIGFTNGMLSVLGPDGAGLKAFLAHRAGVVAIAPAGTRTYTLAADGSINGWSSALPHPSDDNALSAWHADAGTTFVRESVHALAVTWNCGESKPESGSAVFRWLHEQGYDKSLVLVGLQEVEMGSTSVALAAAKNALATRLQEKGNANAQFWSAAMLEALGGDRHWHQVALRQLSGMLIVAFARNNLRGHIGEVETASVACGVLGVGGNKGAVAAQFTLHRQKIAAVCSHFAAHQNAVKARNANYASIAKTLTFVRRPWLADEDESAVVVAAEPARPTHQRTGSNTPNMASTPVSGSRRVRYSDTAPRSLLDLRPEGSFTSSEDFEEEQTSMVAGDYSSSGDEAALAPGVVTVGVPPPDSLLQGEGLRSAAAVVWLGDFNYRIDGQYDQVKELAVSGELGPLLECDQLRREIAAGRVFGGMREGAITFAPTYKFDKGVASPSAYDSSEKRRVPAWCDRIFYRGSVPFSSPEQPGEDEEASLGPPSEGEVRVAGREYGSWTDVYESDHRPVYAGLEISLPVTDASRKRALVAQLLQRHAPPALALSSTGIPEAELSTLSVRLHPGIVPDQMLLLTNSGVVALAFEVVYPTEGSFPGAVGSAAFAGLLEVWPVRGVVDAGAAAEIRVRATPGGPGSYSSTPREVAVRVLVGPEYGAGGEVVDGKGRMELEFTAVLLPEFSNDDKF